MSYFWFFWCEAPSRLPTMKISCKTVYELPHQLVWYERVTIKIQSRMSFQKSCWTGNKKIRYSFSGDFTLWSNLCFKNYISTYCRSHVFIMKICQWSKHIFRIHQLRKKFWNSLFCRYSNWKRRRQRTLIQFWKSLWSSY